MSEIGSESDDDQPTNKKEGKKARRKAVFLV